MSGQVPPPLPPSIQAWRGEFMQAAASYEARMPWWRRRLLGPLIALLVVAGAGGATAAVVHQINKPEMPPFAGESHGYVDLETGEPIRCPDGELLTYTPPPGTSDYGPASCADGSVPIAYQEQRQALLDYMNTAEFGTPVARGPWFAFELEDREVDDP